MSKLTNKNNLGVATAVFLAQSDYDSYYKDLPKDKILLSATSLLRPIRKTVLELRANELLDPNAPEALLIPPDVIDFISAKFGTAVHNEYERCWTGDRFRQPLKQLGIAEHLIDKIRINPKKEELFEGCIPIYLEKRSDRIVGDYVVSGKFDMVAEGSLLDIKTTSTFTYVNDAKAKDYILQGSIYRWLNPDIITGDTIRIVYIFTDFQKFNVEANPSYPRDKIVEVDYQLMTLEDTDKWINDRIATIAQQMTVPIDQIIECPTEDLWMSEEVWKYYASAESLAAGKRCTKRYDNAVEANARVAEKGGIVVHEPGIAKACNYCGVYGICNQKNKGPLNE